MSPLRAHLRALPEAAERIDAEAARRCVEPRAAERQAAAERFPSPDVPEPAPLDVAAHVAAARRLRLASWALLGALAEGEPDAERSRDHHDANLVAQGARRCATCQRVRPLSYFVRPLDVAGQRRICGFCEWKPREEP